MKKNNIADSAGETIKALGLVFGDIGTSPIYTLTIIFVLTPPTNENIMGILSLIIWTLIVIVSLEYAWLAMSLSKKGEGGIIALKEILSGSLKSTRKIAFTGFLGLVGVSLLLGDGVITPAISILSAVEGLELIPGFGHIETQTVIIITCVITILLFSFQSKGTDKIASSFGPIMIIWFSSLFISGMLYIYQVPDVITAVSPHYAIGFMLDNGFAGFFILSEVILCATGGEALYADMGHLGRKPIRTAWYFVFVALVANYFGQGAFLLTHQKSGFVLFEMIKSISPYVYIPFLIVTLLATIIASQAMISAVMSLIYQGITTRIFPLMHIKFTSSKIKSQIYIPAVNWSLLIVVILMIFIFQKSLNLAAAYGFAVTATMTISALFMVWIFRIQKRRVKFVIAIIVFIIDSIFLIAVFDKLPHGGFWSIIIAFIPFLLISVWVYGNRSMHKAFRSLPRDAFVYSYKQIYELRNNIKGTALFFTHSLDEIPPYIVHCIIRGNIIYENNILISIQVSDQPYGIAVHNVERIAEGLSGIVISPGYMEVLNLPDLLKQNGIDEKAIFYGVEEIETKTVILKIFAFIKMITPPFVRFYKLPYNKLHGVVTRLEI